MDLVTQIRNNATDMRKTAGALGRAHGQADARAVHLLNQQRNMLRAERAILLARSEGITAEHTSRLRKALG